MHTQQSNSWMVSLGVQSLNSDFEYHHRKTEIIQQLKAEIIKKIDAGIAGRENIYKALLAEDKIPVFDEATMTIKAFGRHLYSVLMTKARSGGPTGEKAKKIVDLFDGGVSEDDIVKNHGFDSSYAYVTLVKYGRIEKRSHAISKRHDSLMLFKVDALLKDGLSVVEISQRTGAAKKYVQTLRLVRRKAISLLDKGKSAHEVCVSVRGISKNYAQHLEREVKSL